MGKVGEKPWQIEWIYVIDFQNNTGMVLEEFRAACLRALERCGEQAEGYAKDLTPVDTGNLRNSITHQVDEGESAVYIGTDVEYALMWNWAPENTPRADGLRLGPTRTMRETGTGQRATRRSVPCPGG